jgi:cell cycle checkpoint protein
LSGPAGAGKTATLQVLSKELGFNITEWKNASDDVFTDEEYCRTVELMLYSQLMSPTVSLSQKFQAFMNRASGMVPLATSSIVENLNSSRQVVLLEDLPNLLHAPTLQTFQSTLADHIENSEHPIVLVISDAGSRGEHRDEEGWLGRQSSTMDVRTIIPPSLLQSPYVTRIE